MDELKIEPLADGADAERVAEIMSMAFAGDVERMRSGIHLAPAQNVRVARRGNEVVASLYVLDLGQWFGGKCVPMAGVAAVCVAPESRGSGAAGLLMRSMLAEQRSAGVPISTLYPASVALYRKFGYEIAGTRFAVRLAPKDIPTRSDDRRLQLRPATDADEDALNRLYDEWARPRSGNVRRNAYMQHRVRNPRNKVGSTFVVLDGDSPCGYMRYGQDRAAGGHHQSLEVTDWVALTPAAHRRLLAFLADHRSLVGRVDLGVGPTEPLLDLLPEQSYTMTRDVSWMLRILDVERALAGRGYAPFVDARLEFELKDAILTENTGRYVLRVSRGKPAIERGGNGAMKLTERSFASIYTGYRSARDLQAIGEIEANEASIAAAEAIFVGPTPWMRDMF